MIFPTVWQRGEPSVDSLLSNYAVHVNLMSDGVEDACKIKCCCCLYKVVIVVVVVGPAMGVGIFVTNK